LNWRRHIEGALHLQVLAIEVDVVDGVVTEAFAPSAVIGKVVSIPAAEQRLDDGDEFLGALVFEGWIDGVGEAEILAVIDRVSAAEDNVESCAALAEVVKGGDLARDDVRMFQRTVRGHDDADAACDRGEIPCRNGQVDTQLELRAMPVPQPSADAEAGSYEDVVELAALREPPRLA
jgi:hypothetical protein